VGNAMKRSLMMFIGLRTPAMVPVENPVELVHVDCEFCWCDPAAKIDEDGKTVLIHKEVTWN
jgi:hypothetical protein